MKCACQGHELVKGKKGWRAHVEIPAPGRFKCHTPDQCWEGGR